MIWLWIGLTLLASWASWVVIHEFSHLLAAKSVRPVLSWKFYPFPHMHEGNWYWARMRWTYQLPEYTPKERFWVKIAPRVPNLIAAICFALLSLMPMPFAIFWGIFWGAGLVDFAVGSIGSSSSSDLQGASRALDISPWILRMTGFSIIVLSALLGLLLLL